MLNSLWQILISLGMLLLSIQQLLLVREIRKFLRIFYAALVFAESDLE